MTSTEGHEPDTAPDTTSDPNLDDPTDPDPEPDEGTSSDWASEGGAVPEGPATETSDG